MMTNALSWPEPGTYSPVLKRSMISAASAAPLQIATAHRDHTSHAAQLSCDTSSIGRLTLTRLARRSCTKLARTLKCLSRTLGICDESSRPGSKSTGAARRHVKSTGWVRLLRFASNLLLYPSGPGRAAVQNHASWR
jgi:hypothetical protein